MAFANWALQPDILFQQSTVIPVVEVNNLADAIPMAQAIIDGGIGVLEVTLRTSVALDVIRLLSEKFPDAIIGAGTIINAQQLQQAIFAGAKFAISPGLTAELLAAGKAAAIPLIPGIATSSELMQGIAYGYNHFKFFPAETSGGIKALASFYGPFSQVRFCPTGGITPNNAKAYLSLPNVDCVGGSWLTTKQLITDKNWLRITELSAAAIQLANN